MMHSKADLLTLVVVKASIALTARCQARGGFPGGAVVENSPGKMQV